MFRSRSAVCPSLILSLVIFTSACFTRNEVVVKKVDSNLKQQKQPDGVFYALPRTLIDVRVPVRRQDAAPGEYPLFSKCFFPKDVAGAAVIKADTSFTLGTAELTARGVPDNDEVYVIKTKGGLLQNKTLVTEMTEAGLLTKATATSEDTTIDVAIGAFKGALSIATSLAGLGSIGTIGALKAARSKPSAQPTTPITLSPEQSTCYEIWKAAYLAERVSKPLFKQSVIKQVAAKQNTVNQIAERRLLEEAEPNSNDQVLGLLRERIKKEVQATMRDQETEELKRILSTPTGSLTTAQQNRLEQDNLIKSKDAIDEDLEALKEIIHDDFDKARQKFAEIEALEAQLAELLKGKELPNTQADALRVTIDQLQTKIDNLRRRYFLGTSATADFTASFAFDPGSSASLTDSKASELANNSQSTQQSQGTSTFPLAKRELFNFSAKGGICQLLAKEDGIQVPPKFKIADNCTSVDEVKPVTITVFNVDSTKPMDQVIADRYVRDPQDKGDRGFYYRIPRRTFVKLFFGDVSTEANERARKEFMIAQLGITASIPSKIGGRKTKYELALFESSGALKNFTMGSDALVGKAQVEEVTGAVTTAIDAKAKRKQAETDTILESQDDLKRLKREREILEEQQKIDELKKKRGEQPPTP